MQLGETTPQETRRNLPWKPGQSGNPAGRPKGSKNRLKEKFLDCLADDFDAHGISAIVACRETNPAAYLKVVASLLPQDVTVTHKTVFDEMSADDLLRLVNAVASDAARPIGSSTASVIEAEAGTVQTVSEAEVIP